MTIPAGLLPAGVLRQFVRNFVTIQVCLEGKTILGKTIKAFSPLKVQSLQKKQKPSRKDAEPQRYRKEKPSKGQTYYGLVFGRLCGTFAPSRLCVRF